MNRVRIERVQLYFKIPSHGHILLGILVSIALLFSEIVLSHKGAAIMLGTGCQYVNWSLQVWVHAPQVSGWVHSEFTSLHCLVAGVQHCCPESIRNIILQSGVWSVFMCVHVFRGRFYYLPFKKVHSCFNLLSICLILL